MPAYAGYRDVVMSDGPAAYWRLGERSGPTAADETAGRYDGRYVSGTTLGVAGAIAAPDTAIAFNGRTGAVVIPGAESLGSNSAVTIEAWIRPATATKYSSTIVRKDDQFLVRLKSRGRLVFRLWKSGSIREVTTPEASVTAGGWHHVVCTWDGTTMTVYVDAVARATRSLAAPADVSARALYFGSSSGSYDAYAGALDETAVYGAALSVDRVEAHHRAANPPPYGDVVLGDGPGGYWRLGDDAADETDNGNHGSLVGGPSLGVAGVIGDGDGAMALDGRDDAVGIPSAASLGTGSGCRSRPGSRPDRRRCRRSCARTASTSSA